MRLADFVSLPLRPEAETAVRDIQTVHGEPLCFDLPNNRLNAGSEASDLPHNYLRAGSEESDLLNNHWHAGSEASDLPDNRL